jgi:hypothetical protein
MLARGGGLGTVRRRSFARPDSAPHLTAWRPYSQVDVGHRGVSQLVAAMTVILSEADTQQGVDGGADQGGRFGVGAAVGDGLFGPVVDRVEGLRGVEVVGQVLA